MKRRSWLKKKKLPLAPAASPVLKIWSRLERGLRDLEICLKSISSMARILWKILVEKAVILAPGRVTVPLLRRDYRKIAPLYALLSVTSEILELVRLALRMNSMLVKEFVRSLTLLKPLPITFSDPTFVGSSFSYSMSLMSQSDSVSKIVCFSSSITGTRRDARLAAAWLPF